MKTNERKALQELFNNIQDVRDGRIKVFNELQSLSKENGLPAWCSAEENLKQLVKLNNIKYNEFWTVSEKDLELYEAYLILQGKETQLMELDETLADIKFWKK